MELRAYQKTAVSALYAHLAERDDNPVIEIPTGGGKTPVMAQICRDALGWQSRVMIIAHVKELLVQSLDHLREAAPDLFMKVGVHSAGLKARDRAQPIIVAGVQSAWRNPKSFGERDLILIDEAHRIPPDGEGMYRTLIAGLREINPVLRVVGFTATPFRTSTGPLCTPDGILNRICYRVGVRELIVAGYLCPLRSKAGARVADASGLHVRAGEFVQAEVEALMDDDALTAAACAEILELTRERRSILIFCAGVAHAHKVAAALGPCAAIVTGETPYEARDAAVSAFRAGTLKYLVNVEVFTLGFDAPNVDCVVLLRPTASPGLYYQMVGRGFRLAPNKENCLVLDYAGNVMRHGPVDQIRVMAKKGDGAGTGEAPAKQCPECREIVAAGYARCPECGYEFPSRVKHGAKATEADILSGRVTLDRYAVEEVLYVEHVKKGSPPEAPHTMRVDYRIGMMAWASEWICFEHRGYPRRKAETWWRERADTPIPRTAAEGEARARAGELKQPSAIVIKSVVGEKYQRVANYEWGTPAQDRRTWTIEEAVAQDIPF